MRDVKFRGRRIDNGKWIYGDLRKREYENTYRIASKRQDDMLPDGGYAFVEVIPGTIGQYTGTNDINGKEIYEGDRVRM